jgi:hypothetical protein
VKRAPLATLLLIGFACTSPDPDKGNFRCTNDADCGDGWACAKTAQQKEGTCGKPCTSDAVCADFGKVCAKHNPPIDAKDTGGLCLPGACNPREEICDGIDNDCNGAIDDGAPCPAGSACQAGKCTEMVCDNGEDDDGNGMSDCGDPACAGQRCAPNGKICGTGGCICPLGEAHEESCGDGLDNDCDGKVDCDDTDCDGRACGPGCTCAAAAKTETTCDDGADNDGDGKTDCADSDCAGRGCYLGADGGPIEANCSLAGACVAREAVCDDGLDDDGDGKKDCADSDCDGKSCGGGKTCSAGTCQ